MRLLPFLCIALLLSLISCELKVPENQAEKVIDSAILTHYPTGISDKVISFRFRERYYSAFYSSGDYLFTRSYEDHGVRILDSLTNLGFRRYVNSELLEQSEADKTKFQEGLNSVIYFGFLPYRLRDPSVRASIQDTVQIAGTEYIEIRVEFEQEGGGSDFDDEFLYWFHIKTYSLDYFAYKYYREGGGVRFREATNRRFQDEILFQDYLNYKFSPQASELKHFNLAVLPGLHENDSLELLSTIEFREITVKSK